MGDKPATADKNMRHQQNVFEKEVILTEKEKLRLRLVNDREAMKEMIKGMTPSDIFVLFDEDDSGLIDFNEFRKMLPFLDVTISDAKAYRYFNVCDTDGSGEIDIDEFKVALYICDPTAGNSCGFSPSSNVTPMDAFETFDEGGKGFLDEDEFYYALDYMELGATDKQHEDFFHEFDLNRTGEIDYDEFREAFLRLCDIRRELEDRGLEVPNFARRKVLMNMLRPLLIDEEGKERRAMAEAKRYKAWMLAIRDKKKILQHANFRSYQEVRAALDAAGHVYVFGSGTAGQFSTEVIEKMKTESYNFQNFDRVVELWKDRVSPQQLVDRLKLARKAQQQEEARDADRNVSALKDELGGIAKKKKIIDPYLEACQSKFLNQNVAVNTAVLWGRRVHHVACSESCIFALADTGEIFCWGGNNFWWHEIQADSMYQNKWRGDVTARSQLLLGTVDKKLPADANVMNPDLQGMSPDDRKAEIIKEAAKYYNVWTPPPNLATRMKYLEKDILPKVMYENLVFSLSVRGKKVAEGTKMDLAEELYESILLERKLLGARASRAIKELETQVEGLIKRKKREMASKISAKIAEMWAPLREVQAEKKAEDRAKELSAMHTKVMTKENDYVDWRYRIKDKRESAEPQFTARGNSLAINLSGVTPRAAEAHTPRGAEGAIQISAGAAHACLIHKNGQLYSWGVGASGRLGLDVTEFGDPQSDTQKPRVVQALNGRPVLRVSCGYSHTAAIVAGGELYLWGSAATGKCGMGHITKIEECYCSVPTRVIIGADDKRIRKVSCGGSHTAVISENGQMYVFGCGDGGRLGLGEGIYDTIYEPLLVSSLLHERLSSVSCGSTTTLVVTEIRHEWETEKGQKFKVYGGGRVYMAGSRNVLGQQCDVFTIIKSMEKLPVKQVSAGYQHSALVTAEGELYTWGQNKTQCLGVSTVLHYVPEPMPVSCLFRLPENIALGKTAYQSSVINQRDAEFAVNGDTSGAGFRKATCTQEEIQPWLEIDLGELATIEQVLLWNRVDAPQDKTLARDTYTARLFPCWVLIGREPFPNELKACKPISVAQTKFTEDKRLSTWRTPAKTQGRYVRVQLEGRNYLSIAQVEVLGHFGFGGGVGRVSYAIAGRDSTVAVVRPNNDARDIEAAYKRAAYADAENADILRQLETYALEYDKFGRGEVLGEQCAICQGGDVCEICRLYNLYGGELKNMPPGIGGRRASLREIEDFLINASKPEIIPMPMKRKERPSKWDLRKRRFWEWVGTPYRMLFPPKPDVTPEEAIELDPAAILASFHRNEAVKEELDKDANRHKKGFGSAGSDGDLGDDTGQKKAGMHSVSDIEAVQERKKKRRLKGLGKEKEPKHRLDARSSIGTAVNHKLKEFGSRTDSAGNSLDGSASGSVHAGPTDSAASKSGSRSKRGASSSKSTRSKKYLADDTIEEGDDEGGDELPATAGSGGVTARSTKTAASGVGGTVKASVSSKHGILDQPLKDGDVLPTGHVIRQPFPKIIAKKLEETADLVAETKRRAAESVAADKKEKKVQNALFG